MELLYAPEEVQADRELVMLAAAGMNFRMESCGSTFVGSHGARIGRMDPASLIQVENGLPVCSKENVVICIK